MRDVKHDIFVKVDEEGTAAAPATSVSGELTALIRGPKPFEMIANLITPFLRHRRATIRRASLRRRRYRSPVQR
jgi:serine protease inhibitor